MTGADVQRIDDFAQPRLPWLIRAGNRAARPLRRWLGRLDEAGLLAAARRRNGLADFGDPSFREPLRVLLRALETEARLTPLGRLMARQLLLQLLCTRLRAEELLRRHPEILEEEVRAPLFIVGLPRSGTTHLHNLVSQHPALRFLPYWESLEPIPPGGARPAPGAPDPRLARCATALRFQHWVMPQFRLMHEMTPEAPHEEIQLLAVEFSTMLFETMYPIPSYGEWYQARDQTGAYRGLRRMLQILQWLRGPRRWALKSPQHLEQLGPLLAVFPDALVVQTHRDPLRILASLCTMIAYSQRMQNAAIDPCAVGLYWQARLADLLRATVEQREHIPAGQVTDVRFRDFMADERASVERVLAFAGLPLDAAARAALEHTLAEQPRGKYGRLEYRLEDFGIDPGAARRALRFYQECFGIPDE